MKSPKTRSAIGAPTIMPRISAISPMLMNAMLFFIKLLIVKMKCCLKRKTLLGLILNGMLFKGMVNLFMLVLISVHAKMPNLRSLVEFFEESLCPFAEISLHSEAKHSVQ